MTQLHLAVIVQVDRRGCADKIHPVLIGDAVDQFILAKGGAHIAVHRVNDLLGKITVHFVPVHPAVIKIPVLLGAGGSTVVGLFCALRGAGQRRSSGRHSRCAGCAPRRWDRCAAAHPDKETSIHSLRHGQGRGCTDPFSRNRCGDRVHRSPGRPRCRPEGSAACRSPSQGQP